MRGLSKFGCAFVALAVAAALGAGAAQAQTAREPVIVHMFTGPDGLTHTETLKVPFNMAMDAVGTQFGRVEAGSAPRPDIFDWHTAPHKRYVVTLSGSAQIEVSGSSEIVTADRDHITLAEDLTGKGHRYKARPVGPDPWVYVFLEITKDAPK